MEGEEGEICGGSEGEVRGMDVTVGNAEMNSDGDGEIKESVELAETIKSFQKEVQSYRVDNERILIQINDRLVHILNEIQRRMSSDSRRRRDPYKERKRSRGFSKSRRPCYSSSSSRGSFDSPEESRSSPDRPSDKRKRRRHRMDELQGSLGRLSLLILKVIVRKEKMLKLGCYE